MQMHGDASHTRARTHTPIHTYTWVQGLLQKLTRIRHARTRARTHAHTWGQGLFNNAAQSWNHDFYWKCMKPSGGGEVRLWLYNLYQNSSGYPTSANGQNARTRTCVRKRTYMNTCT